MGSALIHILWGLVVTHYTDFLNPVYLVPVLSFTIYAILNRLHNLSSLIFSSVN